MIEIFTPERETWLHRVNPAFKFIILFIFLILILFNQNLVFTCTQMIFYAILLYGFSGYSIKKLALFSIPAFLSFFSSALSMTLFGKGEIIWWQWGLLKISEESFFYGLLLGSKALSFGLVALIILLTTKPILLFYALMQQFKFTPKYAYSFIASVRLIPIIIDELLMRNNALKVRGVHFGKGIKGLFGRLKQFTVPLFAQSIRRAQRIAVAMEAKRFQMNEKRTYYYVTSYSKMDTYFIIIMLLGLIISYLLITSISVYLKSY